MLIFFNLYNHIDSCIGTHSANVTTAQSSMSGPSHALQQETSDADEELSKFVCFPPTPHPQASIPWAKVLSIAGGKSPIHTSLIAEYRKCVLMIATDHQVADAIVHTVS